MLPHKKQKGIGTMAIEMTELEMYNALMEMAEVKANPVILEKVTHKRDQALARKSAPRGKSKAQLQKEQARQNLARAVVGEMIIGQEYTISEMIASLPSCTGCSVSGLTSVMGVLVATGEVVRTERKRKAYFTHQ